MKFCSKCKATEKQVQLYKVKNNKDIVLMCYKCKPEGDFPMIMGDSEILISLLKSRKSK